MAAQRLHAALYRLLSMTRPGLPFPRVCTHATVMCNLQFKGNLPTETGRRTPALKSDSRVSPPIDLKQFCSTGRLLRHQIVYLLTTPAQVGLIVPRQGDRAFCRGPICLTRESGCDQFYSSIFCSLEPVEVTRVNDRPSLFICVVKKLPMPLWPLRLRPPPLASLWMSTQL